MENLSIREAQPSDVAEIFRLMREFAEYEKLLDFFETTETRLQTALFGETKVAEAIVALNEQTIIAYAVFYPNFSTFRGQRGLYLEDIFITKPARGRGLGETMLKYIARLARERGFERIDFQVLQWNAPAIEFYERLGAVRDDEERHFKFTDEAFRNLAR